jgi:hypothetical protein
VSQRVERELPLALEAPALTAAPILCPCCRSRPVPRSSCRRRALAGSLVGGGVPAFTQEASHGGGDHHVAPTRLGLETLVRTVPGGLLART